MNNYEQATQEVRDAFQALCKSRVEAAVKAEREACAKVCDEYDGSWYVHRIGAQECAAAIRARGEASLRSNA